MRSRSLVWLIASFGVVAVAACKREAVRTQSVVKDAEDVRLAADVAKGVLTNRAVNTCGRESAGPTSAPQGREWVMGVPYQQRLDHVKWLGKEFPGYSDQGINDLDGKPINTGLWDGIYLQTQWQLRSARDKDYWWAQNNWSLTEVPFWLGQLYRSKWKKETSPSNADIDAVCADDKLAALDKADKAGFAIGTLGTEGYFRIANAQWPSPSGGAAPHTSVEVCQQLMKFYRVSDNVATGRLSSQPTTKASLRKEMWRMHEWNLGKANAGAKTSVHACQGEKDFQIGWAFIVNYVGASAIPSSGEMIGPGQPLVMPMCYPLGAPGCQKANIDHSMNLFMVMLREIERVGRGNPRKAKLLELFLEQKVSRLTETADGIAFLFTGDTSKNPDVIAVVEKFAAAKGSAIVAKAQALEAKVIDKAASAVVKTEQAIDAGKQKLGQTVQAGKAKIGATIGFLRRKAGGNLRLAEGDGDEEAYDMQLTVFADVDGDGMPEGEPQTSGLRLQDDDDNNNNNNNNNNNQVAAPGSGEPSGSGDKDKPDTGSSKPEVAMSLDEDLESFTDLIDALGFDEPASEDVPSLDELQAQAQGI